MKNKIIYYGLPLFLLLYILIAWTPLLLNLKTREFFPFFAFNLYSFVPNKIESYNLLVMKDQSLIVLNHRDKKLFSKNIKIALDKSLDLCLNLNNCENLLGMKSILGVDSILAIVQYDGYYYEAMRNKKLNYNILKNLQNGKTF